MITADAQQLEPGGRITVYELDASSFGADKLFFHAHLQSGLIWWQAGIWPLADRGQRLRAHQRPAAEPTPARKQHRWPHHRHVPVVR